MAKNVNSNTQDNLGYLGEEYQTYLVKSLIEDHDFFEKLNSILDQNMFTNAYLKRIVGFMKDRYNDCEAVPTYKDLEFIIKSNVSKALDVNTMVSMLNEIDTMEWKTSMEVVEKISSNFFKQQNLVKAINKAQDIIKGGKVSQYPDIEELFTKALESNNTEDKSFRLFENLETDLSEDYRKTIPTGAKDLDEALFGGLGKGELGLIVAPLGTGKSSSTTGFAAYAATAKTIDNNFKGYKVLHYFFEDSPTVIRRKYYGYVTDIDACDLSKPDIRPKALEILGDKDSEIRQMLSNNIIGERLTTGEETATDIKQKIKKHISKGFKPDLVIIDYFECIEPERTNSGSESEWSKEAVTMRKLEAMANELNIALWVPIQGTKDSIGAEVVGISQAGGSVKKTQIGHVIITFAQTPEMKQQGRINMFLGKLRAARIGRTKFENVKFNNGTCKFDFDDTDEEMIPENSFVQRSQNNLQAIANNTYKRNFI